MIKLFISYARKDVEHVREFLIHLEPLKRSRVIGVWHDQEIAPGEDWDDKIKTSLRGSDVVVFLLSADLLASNYVYDVELKIAYERHKKGEIVIVPVMLRKCSVRGTLFEHIQGLPKNFEPILSPKWHDRDHAYFDVEEGLSKIADEVILKREKAEQDRLTAEREEARKKERLEQEILEREKAAQKKLEAELAETIRQDALQKEQLERERLEREQAERERINGEQEEAMRQEEARKEEEARQRMEEERAEEKKLAAERRKAKQLEVEQKERERLAEELRNAKRRELALDENKKRQQAERLRSLEQQRKQQELALKQREANDAKEREQNRQDDERLRHLEEERLMENKRRSDLRKERWKIFGVCAFLFVFLIGIIAWVVSMYEDSQMQEANDYYDKKDYVKAFRKYSSLRNSFFYASEALNTLGYMYQLGQGVDENDTEAVICYKKSAAKGNSSGEYNLGVCFENGTVVTKSDTVAAMWFNKSAEQGNAWGQRALARQYRDGRGVNQNDTLAAMWYCKAAKRGDTDAQCQLGLMYEKGQGGLPQNNDSAIFWIQKAAVQKDSEAVVHLQRLQQRKK